MIDEMETMLLSLLKGEHSSLSIGFNDSHASSYLKPEDDEWLEDDEDWVSPDEKVKAFKDNTVWTAQWYPNTPIGFNKLHASSLTVLIEALSEKAKAV